MEYPGRIIKAGEKDAVIVRAVKQQLNEMLGIQHDPSLRLDASNSSFGPKMKQLVQLFQARHVDFAGRPLKQDGKIGSLTWSALFGNKEVIRRLRAASPLLAEALRLAAAEEAAKVREVPRNSNRGPQVDQYLKRAGTALGNAWCCAFVYWCMDEAARSQGLANPMVKTAGCLDHWNRAASRGASRVTSQRAINDPSLVMPGMIFIMDHGRGLGHTGFVEKTAGGILTTIEGNTDASKTREGGGVYRLTRKIGEISKGFIDYAGC